MYKNAIKIVWGVKNCAPFTKNMALFEEFFLCSFLCYFWPNSVRLRAQKFWSPCKYSMLAALCFEDLLSIGVENSWEMRTSNFCWIFVSHSHLLMNQCGIGVEAVRNTNLLWNAVMEGVIRISHLIELVYSQKIPKKLVKKILWYYLVTIPNYV